MSESSQGRHAGFESLGSPLRFAAAEPRGSCIPACTVLRWPWQLLSARTNQAFCRSKHFLSLIGMQSCHRYTHKVSMNSLTRPPVVTELIPQLPNSKFLRFQWQALLKKKARISLDPSLLLHATYLRFALLASIQSVGFLYLYPSLLGFQALLSI